MSHYPPAPERQTPTWVTAPNGLRLAVSSNPRRARNAAVARFESELSEYYTPLKCGGIQAPALNMEED